MIIVNNQFASRVDCQTTAMDHKTRQSDFTLHHHTHQNQLKTTKGSCLGCINPPTVFMRSCSFMLSFVPIEDTRCLSSTSQRSKKRKSGSLNGLPILLGLYPQITRKMGQIC